jgi:alpha-1,3-glucan synthase
LTVPPYPYVGWTFHLNDKNSRWWLTPRGSAARSAIIFVLFTCLPLIGGILSLFIFTITFYPVKVNVYGNDPQGLPWWRRLNPSKRWLAVVKSLVQKITTARVLQDRNFDALGEIPTENGASIKSRKVLIATLEYEILGWDIKVR